MEFIQNILALDWKGIGLALLSIYGGLKAIAAITPWTGDDKIVNWIAETLGKLGIKK